MKSLKIVATFALVMVFGAFNLQAQYAADAGGADVVETAASDDRFSTLVSLVEQAGLSEALQDGEEFTIFAPTNEAFEAVPEETMGQLRENPDMLREVLLSHVVVATVNSELVTQIEEAPTASGVALPVQADDSGVRVGNATVVEADIEASNGIIHAVDQVIMPQQQDRGGY